MGRRRPRASAKQASRDPPTATRRPPTTGGAAPWAPSAWAVPVVPNSTADARTNDAGPLPPTPLPSGWGGGLPSSVRLTRGTYTPTSGVGRGAPLVRAAHAGNLHPYRRGGDGGSLVRTGATSPR